MFDESAPCLLMVSGGSDSTALAYIARELKNLGLFKNAAVLHVNHMLRGQDSDADEEFVEELCKFLEFPLFKVQVDITSIQKRFGGNLEAICRNERYAAANEALLSLCQHCDYDNIYPFEEGRLICAHTLDDRAETFYMRSIVGTGPGGFRSIKHTSKNVCRPLLDLTRAQLRDYIEDLKREGKAYVSTNVSANGARDDLWREDKTNFDTDNFRAFVRHSVLPMMAKNNASHLKCLGRTMDLIAEEDDYMQEVCKGVIDKFFEVNLPNKTALIAPDFALAHDCIKKRCATTLLKALLPKDVRVENSSVLAVTGAFLENKPKSGYVKNLQCDMIVSSNKLGARIEPVATFRARRKKKN